MNELLAMRKRDGLFNIGKACGCGNPLIKVENGEMLEYYS